MALLGGFNRPKIRQFNHKPIYWDPEKEEREKREARIKQELNMTDGQYRPNIRKDVFQEQRKTKSANKQMRLIRLFLLSPVIISLFYWLF